MLPKLGLTYDDVLLVPKQPSLKSRKEVTLKTNLTPNITLANPTISANMDTVTESEMAIAMAKLGGIGFIHRFLGIQEQINEVKKAKRWANHIIENPLTIHKNITIQQVKQVMEECDTGGIIVVNGQNKPIGIVTSRDVLYESGDQTVTKVMTPKDKLTTAHKT